MEHFARFNATHPRITVVSRRKRCRRPTYYRELLEAVSHQCPVFENSVRPIVRVTISGRELDTPLARPVHPHGRGAVPLPCLVAPLPCRFIPSGVGRFCWARFLSTDVGGFMQFADWRLKPTHDYLQHSPDAGVGNEMVGLIRGPLSETLVGKIDS